MVHLFFERFHHVSGKRAFFPAGVVAIVSVICLGAFVVALAA
jgi:hypothetical protein